jgi:hypothetical protein
MLRFNLIFSLIVSVVFIAGATWFRVSQNNTPSELVNVESVPGELAIYNGSPLDIYVGEEGASTSTAKLTQTDLLGRQLFTDYLNLNSKNQLTKENINNLANSYAENILNLHTASKIDGSKIIVVADSPANLSTYGNTVFAVRSRYGKMAEKSLAQNSFTDPNSQEFSKFMSSVSLIYKQIATELQSMPVPSSLAENHVNLINNYLSSSESAKSLANLSKDSLGAYAALNSYAKNEKEESELLGNIQISLVSNGIIFSNSI